MAKKYSTIVVSDACLAYGSPQITRLADSLGRRFARQTLVIEPDIVSLPAIAQPYCFESLRVPTAEHIYSAAGRIDYVKKAAALIDEHEPDILVICCTFCLPALLSVQKRPPVVIYYAIESIVAYGPPDISLHHHLKTWIDFIIFPEENRAERDLQRCGLLDKNFVIVLNSYNDVSSSERVVDSHKRNGRIIHQGAIGKKQTFSDYFATPEIQRLPIDIYGPIVDSWSERLREFKPRGSTPVQRCLYRGRVDLETLALIRRDYLYSICLWSPADERGLFAPSNKFFEAIADGVPPITAPHPQHVRLVEKYDCGIVMEGWSLRDLREALLRALRIARSERFGELVHNCRKAVVAELNWDRQFEHLEHRLLACVPNLASLNKSS